MKDYSKTYCNPLPIPDYPIGRKCYTEEVREDFRELADPSVLYHDGRWYLYPSCGMAWWSDDFIHWNHERLEPYDFGYAPTIVKHKGKFYITACYADIRVSDNPLGPFASLGSFICPDGTVSDGFPDPMLFSDDDGRLYLYYGCGGQIEGVELDADDPTKMITEPKVLIKYDPDHVWERMGDWNEDASYSWTEGSWMYKRGDTYYLTYSAPGTEWRTYAMGAYKGKSPLGDFEYMENSPFLRQLHGMVKGPGHGCIVDGPNGTTWAFFTCVVCFAHEFERRIGMDAVGFDENGDFYIKEATELPQWAPGVIERPELGNDAGLLPFTSHRRCSASSSAPGREAVYGVDDSLMTWWQPAADDPEPTFYVRMCEDGMVNLRTCRVIWRDVGLDVKGGVLPGPFGFAVDVQNEKDEWVCVADKTDNETDLAVDYFEIKPTRAKAARLRITKHPEGITPGLINLSLFGFWG